MKNLKQKIAGLAGVVLAAGASVASAAVPLEVTTALDDASADTITVAGTVLAIIVGIMALKYVRRAL